MAPIVMTSDVLRHHPVMTLQLVVLSVSVVTSQQEWGVVEMSSEESCGHVIRNDDMSEGDYYTVMSDSLRGRPLLDIDRRPAECTYGFNFADRLVSVVLDEFWCRGPFKELFFAVYEDCEGKRKGLLGVFNCSDTSGSYREPMNSTKYCITLHHYRGHIRYGYFFQLKVIARHELIAFPAGGIAAIVISIIVAAMLFAKILCVVTGYEHRLPNIAKLEDDEQKQILHGVVHSSEVQVRTLDTAVRRPETLRRSPMSVVRGHEFAANYSPEIVVRWPEGAVECLERDAEAEEMNYLQHRSAEVYDGHDNLLRATEVGLIQFPEQSSILRYSRSPRSSTSHVATLSPTHVGDLDPDGDVTDVSIDSPTSPSLKRYPSYRVCATWT